MHELAIAESIADTVVTRASGCHATHVKSVRLSIGDASGVMADSLTFSFEMVASMDPLLTGTCLLIDRVPHRAHCQHCDTDFAVADFVTVCPSCGEWSANVISGTELQIIEMEIET